MHNGYTIVALRDMIDELGEGSVKAILSSFSCPLNKDIEYFLHYRAIEFDKQRLAPTHLVFSSHKEKNVLVGYFTLTIKTIFVSRTKISRNSYDKIKKYGTYNPERNGTEIPAPLIAQLGKNYANNYNTLISGDELLQLAYSKVALFQQTFGGKVVYIECQDNEKLKSFYFSNGFIEFGRRLVDHEESDRIDGRELIQMLKIMK